MQKADDEHNNNNSNMSPRSYGRTLHVLMDQDHRPDNDDARQRSRPSSREYYMGQTPRDIRCAHPCCLIGLYPEDRMLKRQTDDDGILAVDEIENNSKTNFCSEMLNIFLNPVCCGMPIQCCGVCAIAQEAREIERVMLPAPYRRIDYITMEPFLRYYPAIYQHTWKGVVMAGTNNNNNVAIVIVIGGG
jgi:hypothetical protein